MKNPESVTGGAFPPDGALTPVYDSGALDALMVDLGDEGRGVREALIGAYLDDSTVRLEALVTARDRADGKLLASTAHALRSASATIGLLPLSIAAAEIDTALRTFPAAVDVVTAAAQLIDALVQARTALQATIDVGTDLSIAKELEVPAGEKSAVPGRPGSVPTLLLVEDDIVSQQACYAILARLGYKMKIAVNGSDALDDLEHHHYAAVLLDCQMPVLDGYETTRELRRREGTDRHTPVIALTGARRDSEREQCLAAGMDDYLTKPVNVLELAAALSYWIHAPNA